jgi:glycogen debranching enzyme
MVKCLESIELEKPVIKSKYFDSQLVNSREGFEEKIFMQPDKNAIALELSYFQKIKLVFDIRKADDFDEWERYYDITTEKDCIIIAYIKKDSQSNVKYSYYCAINGHYSFISQIKQFVRREYEYDRMRNSSFSWYPFEAFEFTTSLFTLAFSENKEEAIKNAQSLYQNYKKTVKSAEITIKPLLANLPMEIKAPYMSAHYSMEKLITKNGIYAGYPWFFQYWTRDEMISLSYLISKKDYIKVKEIFGFYMNSMPENGAYCAMHPNIGNICADGAGWVALRYSEFLDLLENEKMLDKVYGRKETTEIMSFFMSLYFLLKSNFIKKGMVKSGRNETWMDTSYNDDGREGFCIEIQVLALRILRLLYRLTNHPSYADEINLLLERIKANFLSGNVLYDHLTLDLKKSEAKRPNIFLAYYIYPWLLDEATWEKVFDDHLKSLWLDWGGLSSMDKNDPSFVDNYTGENNMSYHRGDSWFYLNCIAAIAMHKLNSRKYADKINKIISASCTECVENGVIGSLAELSSAKELSGYGCLSQAWSLAMFIEMINTVYNGKKE